MNHIIVEGPDGSGKTTLAKRLCEQFDYEYRHEGPPPSVSTDPDRRYSLLKHYATALTTASKPTVFDRLHLGELVYGPLLRGRCGLDNDELTLLYRVERALGTRTVVCLPPWEVTVKNLHEEEFIKDRTVLERAYRKWTQLFENGEVFGSWNWHLHDYTADHKVPGHLDKWLNLWQPTCPAGVIGSPHAKFLIVGERPNGMFDVPFMSTWNASGYLLRAMREAGFTERETAFTNAFKANGEARDLLTITRDMPSAKTIIALGREAQYQCEVFRLPYINVPHPSYWKRFRHHEFDAYVSILREARYVLQP